MAQYDEDKILNDYFNGKSDGILVEIGAALHDENSNSRFLINKGWSALLVEPNSFFFNKLIGVYNQNERVFIENCCAAEDNNDEIDFYEYDQLSTMNVQFKERVELLLKDNPTWKVHQPLHDKKFLHKKIRAVKTSDLILKYFEKIDFLSIDCEGADFDVIKGIDFDKIHISLLCHEIQNDPLINNEIEEYLNQFGYKQYTKNIGNIFYVNKKQI